MSRTPLFVSTFGYGPPLSGGRPILAIHGLGGTGVIFFRFAQLLPDSVVVAPDLRGHGRSPKVGPWTLGQHVADLWPILDALGPSTVVLGHSLGGAIAWELARAHPDALTALVLVEPAFGTSAEVVSMVRADPSPARYRDLNAALETMLAESSPGGLWAVALHLGAGLEWNADGSLQEFLPTEATLAVADEVGGMPSESSFAGPVLAIEASQANGAVFGRAALANLAERLGDRLAHAVIDSPHTVLGDASDALAEKVAAFIAAH